MGIACHRILCHYIVSVTRRIGDSDAATDKDHTAMNKMHKAIADLGFEKTPNGMTAYVRDGKFADCYVTLNDADGVTYPAWGNDIRVAVRGNNDLVFHALEFGRDYYMMDTDAQRDGYAFEHGGMSITDAFASECSRFTVDPETEYDIPKLVAQLLTRLNDISKPDPTVPDSESRDALLAEYEDYCDKHSLPKMSADELMCELDYSAENAPHIEFLSIFSDRWEDMERREQGGDDERIGGAAGPVRMVPVCVACRFPSVFKMVDATYDWDRDQQAWVTQPLEPEQVTYQCRECRYIHDSVDMVPEAEADMDDSSDDEN